MGVSLGRHHRHEAGTGITPIGAQCRAVDTSGTNVTREWKGHVAGASWARARVDNVSLLVRTTMRMRANSAPDIVTIGQKRSGCRRGHRRTCGRRCLPNRTSAREKGRELPVDLIHDPCKVQHSTVDQSQAPT